MKQSVCGYGRADKAQVSRMVTMILRLEEPPKSDHASDALAVAICHALARRCCARRRLAGCSSRSRSRPLPAAWASGSLIRFEPGQATETELVEAAATGQPGPGRTPFSLVFRAPAGSLYPQAIYAVEHDELGSFEIFLVPIAEDLYEAVFA